MRRRIRISLILLLLAGLVSACGSDDGSTAADDPTDASTQGSDEGADDGHMGDDGPGMPMMGGDDHMGGDDEASDVAEGAREIDVTADDFAFEPDEITVQEGEDIAITLTSVDILHDFTIDELEAHVAADRGETATGGFSAGEAGRYTFYCAVAGHREAGMEGTLIVEG